MHRHQPAAGLRLQEIARSSSASGDPPARNFKDLTRRSCSVTYAPRTRAVKRSDWTYWCSDALEFTCWASACLRRRPAISCYAGKGTVGGTSRRNDAD